MDILSVSTFQKGTEMKGRGQQKHHVQKPCGKAEAWTIPAAGRSSGGFSVNSGVVIDQPEAEGLTDT